MSGDQLRGKVVVITGAASGIGQAAAYAFARRGANVVLAARSELEIKALAKECAAMGVGALAVPTDMADSEAALELARAALAAFGRIDVWVNNAGVALYEHTGEAPAEAFRQAVEIDLLGYAHGARAVLPHFQQQGRGVLINNASVLGKVARPYLASYVASKFGIVGLSSALRQEMLLDAPGVHVCTIMPYSIDTPLYRHAANWTSWQARPTPPVYPAQRVAEGMVELALRPRREMVVGAAGRLLLLSHRLAPGLTEVAVARLVQQTQRPRVPAKPVLGNLFAPMGLWNGVSGGFRVSDGPLPLIFMAARFLRALARALVEKALRRG